MNYELLNELQKNYQSAASILGDYQSMSKTELANGYCDADESGDEYNRSAYYAAIVLRYWYKIHDWISESKSLGLQPEDFLDWMNDALEVAFRYRAWRKPFKYDYTKGEYRLDGNGNKIPEPMYNDPDGPDKVFKRCFFSQRGMKYQEANKDKRRANYQTVGIEAMVESAGDAALQSLGVVSNPESTTYLDRVVKTFLDKNKLIEALIIDAMINWDPFKKIEEDAQEICYDRQGNEVVHKFKSYSTQFDPRQVVKHLNDIDQAFMNNWFSAKYNITPEKASEILTTLGQINNQKLYKVIKKVQLELRQDKELMEVLTA